MANRGLLFSGHKQEVNPLEILKAIMTGGPLPPGASMIGPIPIPVQEEGELEPSNDALHVLKPIMSALEHVADSEEHKFIPKLFDEATKDMPIHKMGEVAKELHQLAESHKKHCNHSECKMLPLLEDIRKRLSDKARLNTQ